MRSAESTHTTGTERHGHAHAAGMPRMCRDPRAILVIDFPDFSRLADEQIPLFHEYVMRPVAEVMDAHQEGRLYDNSWGDAIIAIFDRVSLAAHFSLDLQERLQRVPFAALGMPTTAAAARRRRFRPHLAGLRLREEGDHLLRSPRHARRPARAGDAAGRDLRDAELRRRRHRGRPRSLVCEYVGDLVTPKNFGVLSAYRLTRTGTRAWTGSRS